MLDLKKAISQFGADAKATLSNPVLTGEPEDQLVSLDRLFDDLAILCGFPPRSVEAVGELLLSTLKTRPDFAITLRNVLVGYVEVETARQALTLAGIRDTTRNNGRAAIPA